MPKKVIILPQKKSESYLVFKRKEHYVEKHKKGSCTVKPHQRAGYRVRGYIRGDMLVPGHDRSGSIVHYKKKK